MVKMTKISEIIDRFSLFIKCLYLLTKERNIYYNKFVFVNVPTQEQIKRKKL